MTDDTPKRKRGERGLARPVVCIVENYEQQRGNAPEMPIRVGDTFRPAAPRSGRPRLATDPLISR